MLRLEISQTVWHIFIGVGVCRDAMEVPYRCALLETCSLVVRPGFCHRIERLPLILSSCTRKGLHLERLKDQGTKMAKNMALCLTRRRYFIPRELSLESA